MTRGETDLGCSPAGKVVRTRGVEPVGQPVGTLGPPTRAVESFPVPRPVGGEQLGGDLGPHPGRGVALRSAPAAPALVDTAGNQADDTEAPEGTRRHIRTDKIARGGTGA